MRPNGSTPMKEDRGISRPTALKLKKNGDRAERTILRAANPPCRHGTRSASASASPSRAPGNGILRAETGGRIQAQNAGERREFGSQTAIRLANRPKLRGFCRPLNRVGLLGLDGGGCRDRTDGHRSLASLQNEAARRGFSARNDLSQRMSKSLAGKTKALTMNRYLPVRLRFHSLSSRSRARVVTCSRALRRLQE